ncbi:DNA glycosylase AlkZ-like family protein [Jatrophihabitans sp. YIM 134969]
MDPHRLSCVDARRIAVRAQLLDDDRPVDLVDTVARLSSVQVDGTKAVAPSADLVLWTRLGLGYSPTHLVDALADRRLIEFRNRIHDARDLPLLRSLMAAWRGGRDLPAWANGRIEWVRANPRFREDVLARLRDDGPSTSKQIPDTAEVSWRSSGWNNNRNPVMMLESLELRGEVASTGVRRGRDLLWDLAERVHPPGPTLPAAEARRRRHERRLQALGLLRVRVPKDPVERAGQPDVGEPAVIDGVRGEWRVDPAQLDRRFEGRVAVLSPLDRLVFDRDRMAELFDFDYQLEMYKPAAKRRFGFWALPVLAGDELVGKVDATADRKAGTLRVDAVHQDGAWDDELTSEVDEELAALAFWLQLDLDRRP